MSNPVTALFPLSQAGSSQLPPANNNFSTTLTLPCAAGDPVLTVAAIPGNLPTLISIDNEIILAVGSAGSTLTGCIRGVDQTSASSHNSGAVVNCNMTAYYMNALAAEVLALVNQWFVPGFACVANNGAGQSVPHLALTAIAFTAQSSNIGGMHSTVTNNTRFIAPVNGLYYARASAIFPFGMGAGTGMFVSIGKNGAGGSDIPQSSSCLISNSSSQVLSSQGLVLLNAGDYVECYVEQDSAGNQTILCNMQFFKVM